MSSLPPGASLQDSPRELLLQLPRMLLDPERRDLPCGNAEGLLPVRLHLQDGCIQRIEPLAAASARQAALPLALTPLVDAHVHLDKAFSWPAFPNRAGSLYGALEANLQEAQQRTAAQVLQRGERALDQAWRYGLRAMRSHIDSGGACAAPSWEALLSLQRSWRDRIQLQLVALVPLATWGTPAGHDLAGRVAAAGGLLGGVLGPPFSRRPDDRAALRQLLQLAQQLGCGVDLHIDESGEAPGGCLRLLVEELERLRPGVPVTCSHASSMGLLPPAQQRRLAARLAALQVAVVALPTTNFWLLGRGEAITNAERPLAPLRLLQQAGVAVALGADNVQDPWYPAGDFDPLELLRLAFRATHAPPWQRQGLMPFSTVPARLLGLSWDGVLREGGPADLLITSASSWSTLLAAPPQRRVMRSGRWLPPPLPQQPDPRLASLA